MPDKQPKLHDGYVAEEDFVHVKVAVGHEQLQSLVYELTAREPELAIGVAELFSHMLTLLEGCSMSVMQRTVIRKQLTLLTWAPLLALARAHRRAWEDFLPSEPPAPDTDEKGEAP